MRNTTPAEYSSNPFAPVYVVLLCLGLTACGGGDEAVQPLDANDPAAATAPAATAPATAAPAIVVGALPAGYVRCAGEATDTTCNFTGTQVLAYGAAGRYVTGSVSGPFNCNTGNRVFGDPIYGTVKSCYLPAGTGTPPGGTTTSARIVGIELGQSLLYPSGDSGLVLVSNKAVLVKVNAITTNPAEAKPTGTLRVETSAGQLVQTLALTAPSGALPTTAPLVPSFTNAYTAVVPASAVKSGLRLTARLANGQSATTVNPRVGGGVALKFVAIPLQIAGVVGQVVAGPDRYLQARLPAASVTLQTRAAYASASVTTLPTSESAWSRAFSALLGELDDLHTLEQASAQTLYYGFVPKRTFGLAGLGYVPGNAAIGFDVPNSPRAVLEVMTHEVGHNLSLPHAPCGGPARSDPLYPYANAQLGAPGRYIWGYNADTKVFTDPRRTDIHDIMSYCDGDTFSDYNYRRMQGYLAPGDRVVAQAAVEAAGAPQELMLISGQIDSGKTVELAPLKSLFGQLRPPQGGPYVLRLVTATGSVEYRFALKEVDHATTLQRFGFTIPHPGALLSMAILKDGVVLMQKETKTVTTAQAQRTTADKPQVQATEQDGVLRLTWDHDRYPYLTVTHVGPQRSTLAQDLRGGTAALPVAKLPAGGSFEFSLSDGMNSVRVPLAR